MSDQTNSPESIGLKNIWAGAAGIRNVCMLVAMILGIGISWQSVRETAKTANEKSDSAISITNANTETLTEIKGELNLMQYKDEQAEAVQKENTRTLRKQTIILERLATKFQVSTNTE